MRRLAIGALIFGGLLLGVAGLTGWVYIAQSSGRQESPDWPEQARTAGGQTAAADAAASARAGAGLMGDAGIVTSAREDATLTGPVLAGDWSSPMSLPARSVLEPLERLGETEAAKTIPEPKAAWLLLVLALVALIRQRSWCALTCS